jgi:hypothetical protein
MSQPRSQWRLPWRQVTRDEFYDAVIFHNDGKEKSNLAEVRRAIDKSPYEQWLEGAAQRRQEREDLLKSLAGAQSPAELAKTRKLMEDTAREVGENLKKADAENRTEQLKDLKVAATWSDTINAERNRMMPAQRRLPASAAVGSQERAGPGTTTPVEVAPANAWANSRVRCNDTRGNFALPRSGWRRRCQGGPMITSSDVALHALNRLVGTWTTEATHPGLPGVTVHGTVDIEWLEGDRFLIHRSRFDHRDFPDSISIIGFMERDRDDKAPVTADESQLAMHYFDSRGVFRVYGVSIEETSWRIWRDATGFSQAFIGRFSDDGDSIAGRWQLSEDDHTWNDDLEITYRRSG